MDDPQYRVLIQDAIGADGPPTLESYGGQGERDKQFLPSISRFVRGSDGPRVWNAV